MKKYVKCIIALIICIAMLGGCTSGKQIDYSDTYVEGQDSQENLTSYQDIERFAASDTSYYFITYNSNGAGSFVYEIDKKTQECHPLCNKSDCLHDKEKDYYKMIQCSAFIMGPEKTTLVYYDGYLYYVMYEHTTDKDGHSCIVNKICKRDVKSSNVEVVYATEKYYFISLKLHRGYFYLDTSKWTFDKKDNKQNSADAEKTDVYKLPLDGKGELEKVIDLNKFRKLYPDMWIYGERYYGNHFFLQIMYPKNGKDYETIINCSLETNEWIDIDGNLDVKVDSMFTIFNDKLLFGNGTKIYECDFDGENQREVLDCGKLIKGYAYFTPYCNDGENIFITGANSYKDKTHSIIICDKNYKPTVQKLPIQFAPTIGFDETAFIHLDENLGGRKQMLYWVDKSDYSSKLIYEFSVD